MRARSKVCLVLPLAAGLLACDKPVIKERVQPSAIGRSNGGASPGALPDLDGSVIIEEPELEQDAGVEADAAEADAGDAMDAAEPEQATFTKANLIAAVADCALAAFRAFEERAAKLEEVTTAWAEEPTDAAAAQARAAFRAAMDAFQRAEVFRFGPLAPMGEPGSKGLRDQVYSYPHNNLCKVDQQIVSRLYASPDFATSVTTGRGLAALEYLEYYIGAQNSCSPSITINVDGSWAALSADELKQRRRDYAAAVARDVRARAHDILVSFAPDWSGTGTPSQDNFIEQMKRAGHGSALFMSEQSALNAISNALFYVEIEVKDYKLALPLGISPDCTSATTCPDTVESPFARISTPNIATNLAAFRSVFQGCGASYTGLGFDDWLAAVGEQKLADDMLAALEGAQQAVEDLDPPMEQALVQDPSKVQVVYDALKKLTDQLKGKFISVLALELPRVAEGDND